MQLDEYFKSERERRVRELKQRLAAEEEAAVTRMVEKHSQEMLRLISDKVPGAITMMSQDVCKVSEI